MKRACHGTRRSGRLALEPLENRRLLAVQPVLVADLETAPVEHLAAGISYYQQTELVAGQSQAFFQNWNAATGNELWRTDGTPEGTFLVADLLPGGASSSPTELTTIGDRVFFIAEDQIGFVQLWTSDGTAEGTLPLTDSARRDRLDITFPTVLGDTLYFAMETRETGRELWKTDGTPEGTGIVADIVPGMGSSNPAFLTAVNDELFFSIQVENDWQLWRSDGTESGTQFVAEIGVTENLPLWLLDLHPQSFTPVGEQLFFTTYDLESGRELWVSDGTQAGTSRVKDIAKGLASSDPQSLTALHGRLYFTADDGILGRELWISDGTEAGTSRVADIRPGTEGASPELLTTVGNAVYFTADDGIHGLELWRWRAGTSPAQRMAEIVPGPIASRPDNLTARNGELWFTADDGDAGRALFSFSGDEVQRVAGLGVPGSEPKLVSPALMEERLLFTTVDEDAGWALWSSDGTETGTAPISEIRPGSLGSFPERLLRGSNTLYFVTNGFTGEGTLWRSDSEEGTPRPVTGPELNVHFDSPDDILIVGDTAYFVAEDTFHGRQLWVARNNQTQRLTDLRIFEDEHAVSLQGVVGETVYFAVWNSPERGLWRTDGTLEGTIRVFEDVVPQGNTSAGLATIGNVWFFAGNDHPIRGDAGTGTGLWRTDGTPEGTFLVKDILPGYRNAVPQNFVAVSEVVYFTAISTEFGNELWRTDGTEEGTVRLTDIYPGEEGSIIDVHIMANGAILLAANDGQRGTELWKSDGTPGGFELVADIWPGSESGRPSHFHELDGVVYFRAETQESGNELWRTDGTTAGTYQIVDIFPGEEDSTVKFGDVIFDLVIVREMIFFAAMDDEHGGELWMSDGTAEGTTLVSDLVPGIGSSVPRDLIAANGTLYFTADDGIHGRELFRLETPEGDTNFDGVVDLADFDRLKRSFGQKGADLAGDVNFDGVVDLLDFSVLKSTFGSGVTPVPEQGVSDSAWIAATDRAFASKESDA